jgi:thymidylate synthase (FAD)
MDKFRVEVIAATPNPQQLVWAAMHQDYSEDFVIDSRDRFPEESKAGELIVKHLLMGNRGHYGCYDEETEVLTSNGWMKWNEVREWHNLAAFDLKTQEIKFEVPQALQKYKHIGQVYRLSGQQLDTVVTLDHRMVVKRRCKDNSWTDTYFEYAADVLGKLRRYLKSGFLSESERKAWQNPWNIPPKEFAMLVGFFVSDGMKPKPANQIRFRLKIKRKIDFLYSLGIPVEQKAGDWTTSTTEGDRYVINLPSIGQWFLDKCYTSDGQKCLPCGYLTLSNVEVEALLEGLKNSDGNILKTNWRYASTSTELLDQIQALLHINNLSGNWSIAHQSNEVHKAGYYLHVSDRLSPRVEINADRSRSYTESIEHYDGFVYCATVSTGALIIRRNKKIMVSGNCIEHPQITFNVGYFPHSMMQQIRTHRVGMSFDSQSFRYTGSRIIHVVEGKRDIEDVFYLRPVGYYTDRQGKKYFYSQEQRDKDLEWCRAACQLYQQRIKEGLSEEHARSIIPFDARQHFVMSCNARSLMHLLDLRWKRDAQLEAQKLCELLYVHFEEWMPTVAQWYKENRAMKARLSP